MVKLRIDANKLKKDLKDKLDFKVKSITKNEVLYKNLSELFYDFITSGAPIDTGAFRFQDSGLSRRNNYPRRGKKTISRGHGIEHDAIETRPSGEVHYAAYVYAKMYGITSGEVSGKRLYELMGHGRAVGKTGQAQNPALKQMFLKEVKKQVINTMNEAK